MNTPIAAPEQARRQEILDEIFRQLGYAPPLLPAFLSETELAKVLLTTASALRTRRWEGAPMPPHLKIGRPVLYRPADVVDFILIHSSGATT